MGRIRTNLHLVDELDFRRSLVALAATRGLSVSFDDDDTPLVKALGVDGWKDDPVLEELFHRAQGDFGGWMKKVVDAVKAVLGKEPHLPLSAEDHRRIREEMRRRRAALVFNVTGEIVDGDIKLSALEHLGLIEEWTQWPAGAALYGALWQQAGGRAPATSYNVLVKLAAEAAPLGPLERQALAMARRSAATYVGTIADSAGQAVEEVVLQAEKQAIAERIATAIETRTSFSRTVSDLFWDLKERGLNRDWERVVRSEMAQSFNEGNVAYIREHDPDGDPQVYRISRDACCTDCHRLLRETDGAPRLFKLSELERNGPNNAGRKRADWLPVIGVVHPNCLCSPCQTYKPGLTNFLFDAIRERHV